MFRFRGVAAVAFLLRVAYAQEQPTFRVETDLAPVPVTVTDRRGVALEDLKLDDFRLFDNGIRTEIQHLWRESDLPLRVGIIVDVNYSEHGSIPKERQAVAEFPNRIMPPEDRAFLVSVADRTALLTDFTNSAAEWRKGTERLQRGSNLANPVPPKWMAREWSRDAAAAPFGMPCTRHPA